MDGLRASGTGDSLAFRKLIPTLELQAGHTAPSSPHSRPQNGAKTVQQSLLEGDRAGLAMLLILSYMQAPSSPLEALGSFSI